MLVLCFLGVGCKLAPPCAWPSGLFSGEWFSSHTQHGIVFSTISLPSWVPVILLSLMAHCAPSSAIQWSVRHIVWLDHLECLSSASLKSSPVPVVARNSHSANVLIDGVSFELAAEYLRSFFTSVAAEWKVSPYFSHCLRESISLFRRSRCVENWLCHIKHEIVII